MFRIQHSEFCGALRAGLDTYIGFRLRVKWEFKTVLATLVG